MRPRTLQPTAMGLRLGAEQDHWMTVKRVSLGSPHAILPKLAMRYDVMPS